jgi:hypothetical protein
VLFRALRYLSLLGFANDLAFERFDGIPQVFDKLADDADCGRLIFDLDGDLAAHMSISPKKGARLRRASIDLFSDFFGVRSVADPVRKARHVNF